MHILDLVINIHTARLSFGDEPALEGAAIAIYAWIAKLVVICAWDRALLAVITTVETL